MEKIVPFNQLTETLAHFDNGGRFFDWSSSSDDGIISAGEIAKVAGVFSSMQKRILYLSLAMVDLSATDRAQIESALTPELKSAYQKYFPQQLIPSEAKSKGKLAANAIVTGVPKYIESKADFNGFICVPVSTGKSVALIMIPIIDRYDVYELHDDASSEKFLIAHAKGELKLPSKMIRVAGVLKELKLKKGETESPSMFLESLYYAE